MAHLTTHSSYHLTQRKRRRREPQIPWLKSETGPIEAGHSAAMPAAKPGSTAMGHSAVPFLVVAIVSPGVQRFHGRCSCLPKQSRTQKIQLSSQSLLGQEKELRAKEEAEER